MPMLAHVAPRRRFIFILVIAFLTVFSLLYRRTGGDVTDEPLIPDPLQAADDNGLVESSDLNLSALDDADWAAEYSVPTFCEHISLARVERLCSIMSKAPVKELRGKNLRMMPVGDSVTAGPLGTSSYRGDLIDLLKDGNSIEMVGNGGWGNLQPSELNRLEAGMGMQITNIIESLRESLPQWRPNIVLLHAGTNNMIDNKNLDKCPAQMAELIDLIFTECPDSVVIVALIIPCGFRLDQVNRFNKAVLDLVSHFSNAGKHILAADMNSNWDFSKNMADIAHPNADGYKEMALRWHKAIKQANGLGWIPEPVAQKKKRGWFRR